MAIIKQKLDGLLGLNLNVIMKKLVMEFEDEIVQLNQDQLEKDGEDSFSRPTPIYSPRTVEIKRGLNLPVGPDNRFTYRFEGEMFAKMFIKADLRAFVIDTLDGQVAKKLQGNTAKIRTKDEIFGLTKKSKDELCEQIREPLLNEVRKIVLN